jgi:hypothetical protein
MRPAAGLKPRAERAKPCGLEIDPQISGSAVDHPKPRLMIMAGSPSPENLLGFDESFNIGFFLGKPLHWGGVDL